MGGTSEDYSSFLEDDHSDYHHGPVSSELRHFHNARHSRSVLYLQGYKKKLSHIVFKSILLLRSKSISHTAWEEVHERVRGLLTTPKAVRRLIRVSKSTSYICGAIMLYCLVQIYFFKDKYKSLRVKTHQLLLKVNEKKKSLSLHKCLCC